MQLALALHVHAACALHVHATLHVHAACALHLQESLSQQQRLVGRTRKSAKLVPFLLKADTQGALEAVQQGLSHFPKDVVQRTLPPAPCRPPPATPPVPPRATPCV